MTHNLEQQTIGDVGSVTTLCDIVSALLDRSMGEDNARTTRLLTVAVQAALRDLVKKFKWRYYTQVVRFTASASQEVTVSYTESTRTMVITSAGDTWPSDAIYGEIKYGDALYSIAESTDATTIVLDAATPLGANYTGDVTWQRTRYTFNRDFARMHYLVNLSQKYPLTELTNPDMYEMRALGTLGGNPSVFSVRGSRVAGATDIVISPSPTAADVYEALATVTPREPKVYKATATDGAMTSGSTTFTSASASFNSSHLGAVLRLYDSSNDIPYGIPNFEAFVTEVTDAHTLVLSEAASSNLTAQPYVVSSHVDIEPTLMLTYLQDEAYANYCKNHDHKGLAQAKALAKESLLSAIGNDRRVNPNRDLAFNWLTTSPRLSDFATVNLE